MWKTSVWGTSDCYETTLQTIKLYNNHIFTRRKYLYYIQLYYEWSLLKVFQELWYIHWINMLFWQLHLMLNSSFLSDLAPWLALRKRSQYNTTQYMKYWMGKGWTNMTFHKTELVKTWLQNWTKWLKDMYPHGPNIYSQSQMLISGKDFTRKKLEETQLHHISNYHASH